MLNDLFTNFNEMLNSECREQFEINFNHLGILYSMDKDKDGNYNLDDVCDFAVEILDNVIGILRQNREVHLIENQVSAYCTRILWQEVYGDEKLKKRLDAMQNVNKSNSQFGGVFQQRVKDDSDFYKSGKHPMSQKS